MKPPSMLLLVLLSSFYLSNALAELSGFGILAGLEEEGSMEDRFRFRMRPRRSVQDLLKRPMYSVSSIEESDQRQFQRLLQILHHLAQQPYRFSPFGKQHAIELDKKSDDQQDAGGSGESRDEAFPGLLKVRPQRENRRYLLWRKITGKK